MKNIIRLQDLTIENIGIHTLPDFMAEMHTIKEIGIHDCKNFTYVPEFVSHWKNLESIDIGSNQPNLVWIPPSLTKYFDIEEFMDSLSRERIFVVFNYPDIETYEIEDITDFPASITCDIAIQLYGSGREDIKWRLWNRFRVELIKMEEDPPAEIQEWIRFKSVRLHKNFIDIRL